MPGQANDAIQVSIIIPTYNYGDVLRRVIETILCAEVPAGVRREVLVVDNNSTDDTAKIVRKVSEANPDVIYLMEKERGTTHARNLGIRQARGSLLLFADHDVFVDRKWIASYWDLFRDGSVRVAQGRVLWEGNPANLPPGVELFPYFDPPPGTTRTDDLIACNIAVRKDVFEQYGYFSGFLGPARTGGGEDIELAHRLRSFGLEIHYNPGALVHHQNIGARRARQYHLETKRAMGFSAATERILCNWDRPRRLAIRAKMLRDYARWGIAFITGQKARRLRVENRMAYRRGFLAGAKIALRTKAELAARSPRLSVCIITQNKADSLRRAIASIADLCEEVIVVDGGSADNTEEVARSFPKVKYFLLPWPGNYSEQKNWAFTRASGDWIFSLDHDEAAGPALRARIRTLLLDRKRKSFRFPRYWLVSESPCRYASARKLYPDMQERLFRNLPLFRYTSDRKVHHRFPEAVHGKGLKVRDAHIFHFHFLVNNKPQRQAEAARRAAMEPETAELSRNQCLYDDMRYDVKECEEAL